MDTGFLQLSRTVENVTPVHDSSSPSSAEHPQSYQPWLFPGTLGWTWKPLLLLTGRVIFTFYTHDHWDMWLATMPLGNFFNPAFWSNVYVQKIHMRLPHIHMCMCIYIYVYIYVHMYFQIPSRAIYVADFQTFNWTYCCFKWNFYLTDNCMWIINKCSLNRTQTRGKKLLV